MILKKLALICAGCTAFALFVMCWPVSRADAQSLFEQTNRGVVELVIAPDATSVHMAQDLANLLDDGATRRILAVLGRGATQNLVDVKLLRGIDLGIVRSDVLEEARKRPPDIGTLDSLTYIAKLHNEELHVLAPVAVRSVAELAGSRVSFASTATPVGPAVFELLKVKVEPTVDDPRLALQKLQQGQVAAVVYSGGKPLPLFGAKAKLDGLHLLSIPFTKEMSEAYLPARLTAEDYPGLVAANAPIDTVAVSNILVAAPLPPKSDRYRNIASFVDAFFTQFPRLQEAGNHAKWEEVNLAAPVPGWTRFPPAEAWLRRNAAVASAPLSETDMREAFSRFLDERSRLSGGGSMTAAQKNEMFNLFQQWLKSQRQ